MTDQSCKNTDQEIWRGPDGGCGDYYADSLHITREGSLGINCGGYVYVKPIREWHRLAGGSHMLSVAQAARNSRLQWDYSRIARQIAFLHRHVADRADGQERLNKFLDRLYDSITMVDGEELDLTFCCGCGEEIDGEAWVVHGMKYHEKCCSSAAQPVLPQAPRSSAETSDLAARIERYLDDMPSDGGHSDAAGGDCWDLLREAMGELRALPQEAPKLPPVPIHWARPQGETFEDMRSNVWRSGLASKGDTILVWVNEGDFLHAQMVCGAVEHKGPVAEATPPLSRPDRASEGK